MESPPEEVRAQEGAAVLDSSVVSLLTVFSALLVLDQDSLDVHLEELLFGCDSRR